MSYTLKLTPIAIEDIEFHKRSGNKATLKKLSVLFEELTEHPKTGTGRPEEMKYNFTGCWSNIVMPSFAKASEGEGVVAGVPRSLRSLGDPFGPVLQTSAAICPSGKWFFIFLLRFRERALNASQENKNHFLAEVAALV